MIPCAVIDKSYLQGASRSDIHRLCAAGAFMSNSLFAELMTATPEKRSKCFGNLPGGPNPINILPSIGMLMQYEIMNRVPCTPLIERRLCVQFEFHEGLTASTYEFNTRTQQIVEDIQRTTGAHVVLFREASSVVQSWFPEIQGFPANGPKELIDGAMSSIVSDRDRVRAIYSDIIRGMKTLLEDGFEPPMPEFSPLRPTEIDEQWIWFRNLQSQLLAALEFVRKNGAGSVGRESVAVEHDLLDSEYVALGALSGALASRDKTIQRFFKFLCPQGVLIS